MNRKRHNEAAEEETAPFWMISFSDLMTLLLTFFIMLFSISTIESQRVSGLMQAIGERYVREGASHTGMRAIRSDPSFSLSRRATGEDDPLSLEPRPRRAVTNLAIIPFGLESADLDDESERALSRLANELRGLPYSIVIRGHASRNEQSEQSLYTVDGLAYARARNVREYLISLGVESRRFTLSIIGPYKPLDHDFLHSSRFGDLNTYVEIVLEEE
ncbi:MAG: OmpA family protein [Planctomycetaceae bacterium]|nr:OmpA family protein [Planctomycetaceae bacterium]